MKESNIEYQRPIAYGVYCFTCLANYEGETKFYTVLVGPLLRLWIEPNRQYGSTLGVHQFIVEKDNAPMYVIQYDHPMCNTYGTKVKFELYTEGEDMLKDIEVPMEFELAVAPFMQYKIKEGRLYKREDQEWKLKNI